MSLAEYLDVLVRGRWVIAACAVLALAMGVGYALLATPEYRADALVQVEDKKAGTGALSDLSALFNEASPAETEIEILRSRALVGAVVDELGLEIEAAAPPVPVPRRRDGAAVQGRGPGRGAARARRVRLGRRADHGGAAGGPGRARGRAAHARDRRDGGRFEVRGPDGVLAPRRGGRGSATGGRREPVRVRAGGAPGHRVPDRALRSRAVVGDLQKDLRISEKGKKTGVLQLALEGTDRARIAATLDALSRAYLRQNVERKNAEAAKTLEFLDAQLPELKANLEKAERELEGYRATKGSIDVTMEAQASVTRAVDIEKAISELRMEMAALQQRFTGDHPALAGAREKLQRLTTERERVEGAMRKLPEAELESARRLRDVKVANELYVLLLNRAQELRVVKEGTVGNVRILDAALVPDLPVSPRKGAAVALSLLLGLALGVGLAFVKHALSGGVEDPELIERATGIGVHASIPHSPAQAHISRAAEKSGERVAAPRREGPEGARGGEPAEPPHQPPVRAARGAEQHRHGERPRPAGGQVLRHREPGPPARRGRQAGGGGGRRPPARPPAPLRRPGAQPRPHRGAARRRAAPGRAPRDLDSRA